MISTRWSGHGVVAHEPKIHFGGDGDLVYDYEKKKERRHMQGPMRRWSIIPKSII